MKDVDLARLFENAFPNTLDTTISWHVDGLEKKDTTKPVRKTPNQYFFGSRGNWNGAQSFIVTGDITAEWIRDSTNQLQGYQALAAKDPTLKNLILGAINTQAEYIIVAPYCNAFQPPFPSGLGAATGGPGDTVYPASDPSFVFECKYELDSLAHFLKLANEFYGNTKSVEFLTPRFYSAIRSILNVIKQQSSGSFDEQGHHVVNKYRFQRQTNTGTETLSLNGIGNPIKGGTGLIRSAFRPSDDATILPFFIPANAMISVELKRMANILTNSEKKELANELTEIAETVEQGIRKHGIVKHEEFGDVYAFEVDGYGSHILMDDANLPSLLSLPHLGFVQADDPIYQNTRKMILSQSGNPYYLEGREFSGIGGPHIGLRHAWPMSRLVQAMTSDNDTEIMNSIMAVRDSSKLGLIHESVNVHFSAAYTSKYAAHSLTRY